MNQIQKELVKECKELFEEYKIKPSYKKEKMTFELWKEELKIWTEDSDVLDPESSQADMLIEWETIGRPTEESSDYICFIAKASGLYDAMKDLEEQKKFIFGSILRIALSISLAALMVVSTWTGNADKGFYTLGMIALCYYILDKFKDL